MAIDTAGFYIFKKLKTFSQCISNADSVQWLYLVEGRWRGKSLKCTLAAVASVASVVNCTDSSVTSLWWLACTTFAFLGNEHEEAHRSVAAQIRHHFPGAHRNRWSCMTLHRVDKGCTRASSARSYALHPHPASNGQILQRSRHPLLLTCL